MYGKLKGLQFVILTTCISCMLSHNGTNGTSTESQTVVHVVPESGASSLAHGSCPVEQCHSLLDVLRNPSDYFDSNTTLDLFPGRYYINERVGQLVIANVSNFKIKVSSTQNGSGATIICLPGATLGFAFVHCHKIEISNVEISNCSAAVSAEVIDTFFVNDSFLEVGIKHLEHNITSCNSEDDNHTLCYIFLVYLNSTEIHIRQTAILHSQGVGFFGFDNRHLRLTETTLAHNEINCINFVLGDTNSNLSVSNSYIMYGNAEDHISLASGMNLFVRLKKDTT